MRIVMLCDRIPPENVGGAEKVAWMLARGLRDAGHELHVIATTERPDFEEVREGIATYHLHTQIPMRLRQHTFLWNPQVNGKVKRLYERLQPDVVHAQMIYNGLSFHSLRMAQGMGIPTVFHAHDAMTVCVTRLKHYVSPRRCTYTAKDYKLPPLYNLLHARSAYTPLRTPLVRAALRRADARVVISRALGQALEANGLPPLRVVQYGIPISDFAASDAAIESVRESLGLRGHKVILFPGRLSVDKGVNQMMAALRVLVQRVPNVLLLTLTRASLEEQGLTHPDNRDLLPYIKSGGWLQGESLAAAYHAADVVVSPSIYLDGFVLVNLEAMAASKPTVTTCFGGPPEVVQDGVTGFVINPFDTAAFAEKLHLLLTDSALAAQMGAAGYQRAVTHFSLARFVADMEQVYYDAIARRRGASL